jgi:indole-3-glycerol phosphate synthase
MPLPPSFHDALRVPRGPYAIIGEIKRASPSAGDLHSDLDAGERARLYEALGLSAVSVLTDATFFKGSPHDLLAAAQATSLPILCKDFIIDPVQIYQARAFGAAAVLLICELLTDQELVTLIRVAQSLSLNSLVEAHSVKTLGRAVRSGARVIGVNARNLKTLSVDHSIAKRLVHAMPDDVVKVAESGISSHATIHELSELGYDAFLIGEALSRADDLETKVVELMGGAGAH